ncbi:MAG TPA: inositol monophosphatase family protein [Candidatus Krumholzibacteria bacterium]
MEAPHIVDRLRRWLPPLGEKLLEAERGRLDVRHKGRVDLVTELDHLLQAALLSHLREEFPDDQVVAEEADTHDFDPRRPVWFVDPLDGTTNFVHGFPFYCISIARWTGAKPDVAAVYAPALDELFLAHRGGGAVLERPHAGVPAQTLSVSARARLADSLLATGFPYERASLSRLNLTICAHALAASRGIRRAGSAALDLCYVAAGRLDGFWEFGLAPWDVAAGCLIASESGASVSDFRGGAKYLHGRRIIASTPAIHAELLTLLAKVHAKPEESPLGAPFTDPVPLEGEDA